MKKPQLNPHTLLDNATHYATAAVEIAKQKSATTEEYAMVAGIEEDWCDWCIR